LDADFEILFRCTDKGTHPSRELDRVRLAPDMGKPDALSAEQWAMERLSTFILRDGKRAGAPVQHGDLPLREGGFVWVFRCPTCRRDLQVKYVNLISVMERLHAAGVSSVDISVLPARLVSS
jgi:hypothetical protein